MRLIVNADDFGLTPGINRAISELHAAGALTSATLMATGDAFDDAVRIAQAHPTLGVGCHIVLTDSVPASSPASIPSLIGPDGGSFRRSLPDLLQALFRGKIREKDILREAIAQIETLQQAGIQPTHLDTHKHTHLFPNVTRPLIEAAARTGVRAIRNPFEPAFSLALGHGGPLRQVAFRIIGRLRPRFERHLATLSDEHNESNLSPAILSTDGTLAISSTGQLDSISLARLLHATPGTGTYELCCHPGYSDADLARIPTRLRAHREIELNALLQLIPTLAADGVSLIHYGQL